MRGKGTQATADVQLLKNSDGIFQIRWVETAWVADTLSLPAPSHCKCNARPGMTGSALEGDQRLRSKTNRPNRVFVRGGIRPYRAMPQTAPANHSGRII